MARVVFACALKHHTRRGGRDPGRWQRASQLVTHGELRRAGFVLPADAEAWEDLSVEDAYERLAGEDGDRKVPDNRTAGRASPAPPGPAMKGPPRAMRPAPAMRGRPGTMRPIPGTAAMTPEGHPGPEVTRAVPATLMVPVTRAIPARTPRPGTATPEPRPRRHRRGHGRPARGAGEDDEASSGDAPLDVAAEEQAWDEAAHQAVSLAKAQGSRPGRIEETLHDAHRSRLDWRTLLRQYLVSAARDDYRWSVPNRRFIDAGLYLPSMHCEGIDTLAVLIDTSDSLDTDTLATFWTELRAVAEALRPHTLAVVQVDTEVQEAAVYRFGDLPEELVVKGRGGTDFRPGFAWLDREGITPRCCLYLTDMECDRYPEAPPPYPVLWCNWGPVPPEYLREPWGERIDLAP